jgi:DNA repair protein SbcD/Mre11
MQGLPNKCRNIYVGQMTESIRILLLADTHLGFDLPTRTRVRRRRRGDDFLANYSKALEPAHAGEVDLVVHGGDVFHRSQVPPSLAYQAMEPLARIADKGVPVFIVPGNHERSRLPHVRFATHPGVHIFDRPRTFVTEVRGERVVLAGFPYERRDIRHRFAEVLGETGWRSCGEGVRLLCVHHCVEGATVGPGNFTFTNGADVIRGRDLPVGFAAVFSGHIHRHQILTMDRRGDALAAPVLYPGSIERTSLAEQDEAKGYMLVEVRADPAGGEREALAWEFRGLPARPMVVRELQVAGFGARRLESAIVALLATTPADAVLRLRLNGQLTDSARAILRPAKLRALAPPTMNLEVRDGENRVRRKRGHRPPAQRALLELPLD